MKMYEFWLNFHWSVFLRVQLSYSSIGSDNGLALSRRQAIIWTKTDTIQQRIYAAPGGDELIQTMDCQLYSTKLLPELILTC